LGVIFYHELFVMPKMGRIGFTDRSLPQVIFGYRLSRGEEIKSEDWFD
jgi:hypothetical protein